MSCHICLFTEAHLSICFSDGRLMSANYNTRLVASFPAQPG